METNSQHVVNNKNVNINDDETNKLQSSSSMDNKQRDETIKKVDDFNRQEYPDKLSSSRSTNDNKSDQIYSTSNVSSDNQIDKKNEVEKTEYSHEENLKSNSTSSTTIIHENKTTVPSSPKNNINAESKDETSVKSTDFKSKDDDNKFVIEKGAAKRLTEFQRKKAKYFFNVNLDIENKGHVTWEEVEFYLLFHATTAGKEGYAGGDLEARLSRTTRAFWEYVHDQIPLADGKRDQLTLDQFLDTWASLIDFIVRTNRLPPLVQDLVKLGFELYSTDNGDGKATTINASAFDQLFQKMNLSRPLAIMAYKYLTENGAKPLDAEKIDSLVKAVITSSDDEHDSHFLLPGFFATITSENQKDKSNKDRTPSPVSHEEHSEIDEKPSSKSPPRSPTSKPSNETSTQQPKSDDFPSLQKQTSRNFPKERIPSPTTNIEIPNEESSIPKLPSTSIEQENENIRRLLQFYHFDDGDIVEIADGSVHRLVLVHPERPLPNYIQQNKQLLDQLKPELINSSTSSNRNFEPKSNITLEERLARGNAQKGPTIPFNNEKKSESFSPTNVRQVYPTLNDIEQEEQQRQAKYQSKQQPKPTKKEEKKEITRDDEEKIVAAVIRQLTPIVEKQVSAELNRRQSGENEEDDDDGFIPFPFLLAAAAGNPFFVPRPPGPPPTQSQGIRQQQNGFDQRDEPSEAQFGGMFAGPAIFPPHLLMAMMNNLAQMEGDMPDVLPNMPPPHNHGPAFVEDFPVFVGGPQTMGQSSNFQPHPISRF